MQAHEAMTYFFLLPLSIWGAAPFEGCLFNSQVSLPWKLFFQEGILNVNQPELFSIVWNELFPSSPLFYFIFFSHHSPPHLVFCLSFDFHAFFSLSLFRHTHTHISIFSPVFPLPFLPPSGSTPFLFIIKLFFNCNLLGLAYAQSIPHGPRTPAGGWRDYGEAVYLCHAAML